MTDKQFSVKQLSTLVTDVEQAQHLSLEDWEKVIRVFRQEGLLARLAFQLDDAGKLEELPDYAKKHLMNAQKVADRQTSSVHFETREIAGSLSGKDTKLYILKGAAYCLANTSFAKGRIFSDIDLLVSKDEIQEIESILKLHGWLSEALSKYDEAYFREWAHEVPPMKHAGRGTVIDLHHNLYLPISGRAPEIELFLRDAYELNGFYILRPAAMTLHSIIHLMLNDDLSHGYRDLNDLHLMFTEFNHPDYWQDLFELAKNSGFVDELYLAFRYSRHFFDTKIDTSIRVQFDALQTRGRISQSILDRLFISAFSPKHILVKGKLAVLAELLVITRAHFKKMPLKVLSYHTAHKLYRYAMETLLGKAFFEKEHR